MASGEEASARGAVVAGSLQVPRDRRWFAAVKPRRVAERIRAASAIFLPGCRRPVGEHAIDVAMDVRDRIGTGQVGRAFDDGVAGKPRIGAAVEIGADLARDDTSVAHDSVLDVDALCAARRAELHLLFAAEL